MIFKKISSIYYFKLPDNEGEHEETISDWLENLHMFRG